MPELNDCAKCNFQTTEAFAHCPQCGGRMIGSGRIRTLGWLLVVLGSFIVLLMVAVSVAMAANFSHFTGTAVQAVFIFVLFAIIIAFGLLSIVAGAWQIKYGRRNKTIMFIGMGLALLLVIATFATMRVLP